jgi:hypothetical protein
LPSTDIYFSKTYLASLKRELQMSKTKNNKSTYKFTAGSQMKILEELN